MKIVFISNYFNHHQQSLSDALEEQTKGQYLFLETIPMSSERKSMGWGNEERPSYVASVYHSNRECAAYESWAEVLEECDAAIVGSAPDGMIRKRIQKGKLTFRYSERPLKNGNEILKYIPRWLRWHWQNPKGKLIYMLCASAYAALDYSEFGMFCNRTYKWGYFPEAIQYESIDDIIDRKEQTELLWCGRFLDWKHPDDAIRVAAKLKAAGHSFVLRMIGTGPMADVLADMIREYDLTDCAQLLGPMAPEEVRRHMERAGIYLFTSDRKEGWGAVLNESMNSGCAVIANCAIGSVPYLLQDGINGFVYKPGDLDGLYEKTEYLLCHPEEQKRLGQAAYDTIVQEWNGQVAAQRLVTLIEHINAGETYPDLYSSGPCSYAEIIEE